MDRTTINICRWQEATDALVSLLVSQIAFEQLGPEFIKRWGLAIDEYNEKFHDFMDARYSVHG